MQTGDRAAGSAWRVPFLLSALTLAAAGQGVGCGSSGGSLTQPDGAPPPPEGGTEHKMEAGPRDSGGKKPDAGKTDGGKTDAGTDGGSPDSGGPPSTGLHVVMGTKGMPGHIVDGSGKVVQLHGADRSGTEFACTYGSFSDGPVDLTGILAMKAWNINAVRVPMNEDCWLGINGVPGAYSGANYQSAISAWVNLLTTNGLVAIVDLHWTAPGTQLAKGQAPMADADYSPLFWSQVAKMFASNGLVIFDLFNEPFITDWGCWTSGGPCATSGGSSYMVAGMASLLKAVRVVGAKNVVILGGLGYSSDMSQWVKSVNSIPGLAAPLDGISIENVAASWHAYDFNSVQSGCPSMYNGYSTSLTCNSATVTAMNTSATDVLAAGFPLVIGESGISAYDSKTAMSFSTAQITDIEGWYDNLLTWAEMQGQGYLAWSWNTDTPPVLVTDYTGTATPYFGVTYQAHLKKF